MDENDHELLGLEPIGAAGDSNLDRVNDLLIDKYFSTRDGERAIHAAACQNRVEVLYILIEQGVDIDPMALSTPLGYAVAKGHESAVEVLLAGGANPTKTVWWVMPIRIAIFDGKFNMFKNVSTTEKWMVALGLKTTSALPLYYIPPFPGTALKWYGNWPIGGLAWRHGIGKMRLLFSSLPGS